MSAFHQGHGLSVLFCGSASRGLTGTSCPCPQPQHMPSVSPILSPSCWASSLLNHASFRCFSVNSAVHTHLLCTQLLLNDQGRPRESGWWVVEPAPCSLDHPGHPFLSRVPPSLPPLLLTLAERSRGMTFPLNRVLNPGEMQLWPPEGACWAQRMQGPSD